MGKNTRRNLSIAAVLIARDEARCIARCLESVRPFVDKLLVLDTGSTDDTPALAQAAGAEVHHLPWPSDFAKARNHALDLADADWNLTIDADEWLTSGGGLLRKWCGGKLRLGSVCVHSAQDGSGAERRNWMPRLLPRGVRYAGRVHEQPVSPLRHERIALHLGHDGYVGDQVVRKQGRNRPLLLAELLDRPGDPYILYQLGKDAEQAGDLVEASTHYAAAYAAAPPNISYRHTLTIRHLNALRKTGRADLAFTIAQAELANWPDSPDFFFVLGHLALARAQDDPAHAPSDWLPLATAAWERCLEIGERPDLEGTMHGCGSHLALSNLTVVRGQMMALAAK